MPELNVSLHWKSLYPTAKKTLKEAKKAGLKTNVTLLYSDDITNAGVQKLPDGWDTDSAEKKALEYTKNVIKELKAADAVPTIW